MRLALRSLQFGIFPGTCISCRQPSHRQLDLCEDCEASFPLIARPCLRCALPLPAGEYETQLCGSCLGQAPPFQFMVAPYRYDEPVSTLIGGFKHRGRLVNGKVLAQCLAPRIEVFYRERTRPELMLPMPLHRKRLRRRGFNQSLELGKFLARQLGLPCDHRLCRRMRNTPSQQGLSAEERQRNMKNAFVLDPDFDFSSFAAVALLDDVVTTGATVAELCRLLRRQGAAQVHVWAIARTCR